MPAILTSPYAGVLADRFERVRVMVASDLLAAASQAALAVVVLAVRAGRGDGRAGRVTAIAIGPFESASAAVVPQVVEEDDLAAANALRGVLENVVQVAGPALGALLLVVVAPWVVFALDAATFLVSAALLAGMRTRSRPVDVTEGGTAGPLRQLRVGLREIGRSRGVALLVGLSVLASFVYGTDTVLLLGAAEERLGIGRGRLRAAAHRPLARRASRPRRSSTGSPARRGWRWCSTVGMLVYTPAEHRRWRSRATPAVAVVVQVRARRRHAGGRRARRDGAAARGGAGRDGARVRRLLGARSSAPSRSARWSRRSSSRPSGWRARSSRSPSRPRCSRWLALPELAPRLDRAAAAHTQTLAARVDGARGRRPLRRRGAPGARAPRGRGGGSRRCRPAPRW